MAPGRAGDPDAPCLSAFPPDRSSWGVACRAVPPRSCPDHVPGRSSPGPSPSPAPRAPQARARRQRPAARRRRPRRASARRPRPDPAAPRPRRPAPVGAASAPASSAPPPDPASVKANELGLVPVLMYHKLNPHPASDYDRRPSDFVADLTYLEKNGFYPVTAANFVAGKIDIPAGKHAVVLTFDDGTETQFALGADGKPKAGTALALLQAFAATHPDFPAVATFYVNAAPFGSKAGEDVLKYLTDHGDEVGDHTVHHYDLATKSATVAQAEIAQNLAMITAADPGYKVTTFALPFGASPKPKTLRVSGSSGGVSYDFAGVFAVGANPAHSPYNAAFEPGYIPRIRAQNQADAKPADRPYISSHWLPLIVSQPAELYTSDGDPAHVSYPKTTTIQVAREVEGRGPALLVVPGFCHLARLLACRGVSRRRPSAGLAGDEDRGARHQPSPQRRPLAPDAVVAGRPLGLDDVERAPARRRRSRAPGRPSSGGARRRSRSRRRRARRTACGRSSSRSPRAAGAGVVGQGPADRVGDREDPAAARTQDARDLGHHGAGVGDERHRAEGGAGEVEATRRRTAARRRRPGPAARGRRGPRRSPGRWRAGRRRRRAPPAAAPWPSSQREHCAAPAPTSSTPAPAQRRRVAEQVRVGLVEALRAPDEAVVAQEVAVLGLVVGRCAVPPRRLARTVASAADGPALDAGDRRRRTGERLAHRSSILGASGRACALVWTAGREDTGQIALTRGICVVWTLRCGPALPHKEQACAREVVTGCPPRRALHRRRSSQARVPAQRNRTRRRSLHHRPLSGDTNPHDHHHRRTTRDGGDRLHHPGGRDQRHRLGRGLPRSRRPHDQVLQRWRHRRGHHRQGRP